MSGRETQFDPSRHGPAAEERYGGGAQISRTAAVARPSHLSELAKLIDEAQSQSAEVSGRLRNNADSLLGHEPEPSAGNGESKPLPPPDGRLPQLIDSLKSVNSTLREARHQLDRLDSV